MKNILFMLCYLFFGPAMIGVGMKLVELYGYQVNPLYPTLCSGR